MKQSKELTEFYNDYYEWAINGGIDGKIFDNYSGLCNNLYKYSNGNIELSEELCYQFLYEGLNSDHPFSSIEDYVESGYAGTMHLCPKRLQWVEDHLEG